MKKSLTLAFAAMMAVGMVGTASAGNGGPPPTIGCDNDPYEFCVGADLVEVELKCNHDYAGGIWVEDDLAKLLEYEGWELDIDWALGVEGDGYVCGALGWHDLDKTEGKCTDRMKGPTKANKKWSKFTGDAVEYEFKTVKKGACDN